MEVLFSYIDDYLVCVKNEDKSDFYAEYTWMFTENHEYTRMLTDNPDRYPSGYLGFHAQLYIPYSPEYTPAGALQNEKKMKKNKWQLSLKFMFKLSLKTGFLTGLYGTF